MVLFMNNQTPPPPRYAIIVIYTLYVYTNRK